MTALLCLGCGVDLAQRMRALQGPPVEGVVDACKAVFENDDDDRLCADTLLAGGKVPGKICSSVTCRHAVKLLQIQEVHTWPHSNV